MKTKGQISLSSDITTSHPGPLDNKMVVNSIADLTNQLSWKVYRPDLDLMVEIQYPFMVVIVQDDGANNGFYQFIGSSIEDVEDVGNWKRLAYQDEVLAADSPTIKGTWTPTVVSGSITNYPSGNNAYVVSGNAAEPLGILSGDVVFINATGDGVQAVSRAVSASLTTDNVPEGVSNRYYPTSASAKLATIETGAQKNVPANWLTMANKPTIPTDVSQLTDYGSIIPSDVANLTDLTGRLIKNSNNVTNLSSVEGESLTDALETLKEEGGRTVKGEWEPILLGEEPIQNLFHQIVPDPIAGSGNPSVSIQDDGKSLLGISNSPGVDWTNVLYFSPAQVSLKFKTTLNSSMGPNTTVSVSHFNSDENRVSEMVAGLNMYTDNKIAVMFVEYDEPNGSVIQTQATAKADVGVDSLDEIYVFILGDDLIVHVNDTEVARATFSNGAPTTTASVTQSKMLCASIGLGDTLEMLEIIPVAMNYPAQFANNAFTIVGNALSPIADDGDIVIGNKAGDGIAKVIGKSEGGGVTLKPWTPDVVPDVVAVQGNIHPEGSAIEGLTVTSQDGDTASAYYNTAELSSMLFCLKLNKDTTNARILIEYSVDSGSTWQPPLVDIECQGEILKFGASQDLGPITIDQGDEVFISYARVEGGDGRNILLVNGQEIVRTTYPFGQIDYYRIRVEDSGNSPSFTLIRNPASNPYDEEIPYYPDIYMLDETAYPANATSNIFEITGTPTPLQWDAIGGTVVDGDLVAFDSAGVPFVVDVTATDLSNYYTKSESDSALDTKVTKPVGFDESTGDEFKYISGKGTLKDVSTIQKLGNMPDVVFATENATVGGNPIGYDALVILDKTNWGFGLVTNLANTQVENSLIVLDVEDTAYQLGNTIYIPSEGGAQALNTVIANRTSGENHSNTAYTIAYGYNAQSSAGIYALCGWDATTKEEVSRDVGVYGETFTWVSDDGGTLDSTMSRLVQTIPATPTSTGKIGQFAADADYLYYCYAEDSWASIPKNTFKTPFGSTINWLEVSTSTFLIEPEHAGMSLWVTADCVITVSEHSTLPTGFNCEILKADTSLIVSVVASGGDTIRDGKSVIVSDASVFKSPSAGVIGLVGDVS